MTRAQAQQALESGIALAADTIANGADLLQGWLMRLGAWSGALLLAALAWWAIIVVPFINFRARSIIGLTLFWAIFGVTFGWLAQRAMQRTSTRSVAALG